MEPGAKGILSICVCERKRYRNERNYKCLERYIYIYNLVFPLVWVGKSGRVNRKANPRTSKHIGLWHPLISEADVCATRKGHLWIEMFRVWEE